MALAATKTNNVLADVVTVRRVFRVAGHAVVHTGGCLIALCIVHVPIAVTSDRASHSWSTAGGGPRAGSVRHERRQGHHQIGRVLMLRALVVPV
jgi:hypothetical protein